MSIGGREGSDVLTRSSPHLMPADVDADAAKLTPTRRLALGASVVASVGISVIRNIAANLPASEKPSAGIVTDRFERLVNVTYRVAVPGPPPTSLNVICSRSKPRTAVGLRSVIFRPPCSAT